jgi:outer membrane receptor for ferrienterochelin and colicins
MAAQPAFAQSEPPNCAVGGVVLDNAGEPLPGATVTVANLAASGSGRTDAGTGPGASRGTNPVESGLSRTTDAAGRFCLASAPTSRFAVIATLDGFTPQELRVDPLQAPARALEFRLRPAFAEALVVTATRTGRRLDDVPVRTELVTREAIERVSARTLADAMEFTTGVRVESNCQNCNFSQIRLLGLEGPYTQILIDGQPVISSLAQVYGIEQLPARMIERIEVVKGGGSALYGPGSVGGVVNVISREPSRRGGVFETRTDLVNGLPSYSFNGAFDWVDDSRSTLVTVFAQSDRVKPVDVTGDGFTEISRRHLDTAGIRVARYVLANRAKLTVDFTRIAEDRRGGNLLRLAPHEADITEAIDSRRHAGTVSWFHTLDRRRDYRVTFATALTDRDSYYGTGRDPNAYGGTESRLGLLDTQMNHYLGRHTFSWGAQGSVESLDDRQPAYARFTRETYRNAGVFVQDEWAFADGVQLLLGVRGDRHSALDRTILSPRAALMISPQENFDIRVSVARGFRAPQLFDEDLHLSSVAGEARLITLAPDLREERSVNLMSGFEWKPELWRGQALVEVNAFHTRLTDLFHVREADNPATDAFEFVKANHDGARVYGMEVNVGWGIEDRLVFQGGIVEQRARYDTAEPDFGSLDFFRAPRRYGNATVTWKHQAAGDFFAGLRMTGTMRAPHYAGFISEDRLETTPIFTIVDASYARALMASGKGRLVLTLTARNLTNAFQRDIDQGPRRDSAYVYGPRFPRAFAAGLRVEF